MKRRIAAVIVLFRTTLEASASYQSLLNAATNVSPDALDLSILLQDNSPEATIPTNLPGNVRFYVDPSNSGLATAYNRALRIALDEGYEWLLTLDQDTELPPDAFGPLLRALDVAEQRPEIGAIVPQVRASGRIVSPNYFAAGAWPRWFASGFTGVPDQAVFAFNSGSLLRVAALRQLGGYSPWFWLDNSDSALYRDLQRYGKRVYVAGDLELQHDFSILNMQERMSPERYRSLLLAESAFWDLHMNALAGLERSFRLLGRSVKHLLRRDPAALRSLTLQQLRRRLFRSRKHRIALWREQTRERLGHTLANQGLRQERLKVSVCMAAYNGARHIEAQLRSILPQLGPGDEIVIVDDASRDDTPALLRYAQAEARRHPLSPTIVLATHSANRGVVRTFEEAVRSATGDILFLCDDDDLWAPDKVAKVVEVFAGEPEVQLVCTGLQLIDEHDRPLQDTGFLRHRHFTTGLLANLRHNQYQGSTMAFRSSLLQHILPFPADRLFLHDAWIGVRTTLSGGRTKYLPEPLLLYRRHTGNYSRRLPLWKQVKLRLEFLGAHLRRVLHRS